MNNITKDVLHRIFELNDLLPDLADIAVNITTVVEIITESLKKGGKVILCGNGGSAADSQHIAAELVSRFMINRKPYAAIALTTNTSVLTAIANDFGYEFVFSKQVEALGKPEDVIIGISTSGRSENIHRALETANNIGMKTVFLTGSGTDFTKTSFIDYVISVPSDITPRIQECHILIGHIICEMVEKALSLEDK